MAVQVAPRGSPSSIDISPITAPGRITASRVTALVSSRSLSAHLAFGHIHRAASSSIIQSSTVPSAISTWLGARDGTASALPSVGLRREVLQQRRTGQQPARCDRPVHGSISTAAPAQPQLLRPLRQLLRSSGGSSGGGGQRAHATRASTPGSGRCTMPRRARPAAFHRQRVFGHRGAQAQHPAACVGDSNQWLNSSSSSAHQRRLPARAGGALPSSVGDKHRGAG